MISKRINDPEMENVLTLADQSIEQLRKIAYELRPSMLDDIGLIASIQWLTNIMRQSSGKNIIFHDFEGLSK